MMLADGMLTICLASTVYEKYHNIFRLQNILQSSLTSTFHEYNLVTLVSVISVSPLLSDEVIFTSNSQIWIEL